MAIYLDKYNLQYFPIPKNACTSLKMVFYSLEMGREFEPTYEADRQIVHIHNWRSDYASAPLGTDYSRPITTAKKLTVIRDPIARILSCYGNRVRDYKELSDEHVDPEAAGRLGVPLNPKLEEFVLNLTKYRALSVNIKHHTDPQTYFVGPNLRRFQLIYKLEDIEQLALDLSRITGVEISLPHEQQSGNLLKFDEIGKGARDELLRITAGDYALLNGYYSPSTEL